MIRLPLTSIGLSEQDIDLQYRSYMFYDNLRAQGFKANDLQNVYKEQQKYLQDQENNQAYDSERTPSCGSLNVAQGSLESEGSITDEVPLHKSTSFLPTSSPPEINYRHSGVRRSSLLRFGENAASDSPEANDAPNIDPDEFPKPPSPRIRTYRPRSQTYAWVESEADDSTASRTAPCENLADEFVNLTLERGLKNSSLRPDAPTFRPPAVPRPFSTRPRVTPLHSQIGQSLSTSPDSNYEIHSWSTPDIPSSPPEHQLPARPMSTVMSGRGPPSTPPRRSSLVNQLVFPSPDRSPSPSGPPAAIETETPTRSTIRFQTQPRTHHGGQYSLRVYNDRISPSRQPRTPADLSRHRILTGREAAYTAPPGSIGPAGRVASATSPTVRAREMRTRFAREYRRAGIVENEQRNQQGPGRSLWRDELDFDRVGEENF